MLYAAAVRDLTDPASNGPPRTAASRYPAATLSLQGRVFAYRAGGGYVTARDVASLQRVLRVDTAPAVAAATKPAADTALDKSVDRPVDPATWPAIARAINAAFIQRSTRWIWDRYVPGSIAIGEGSTCNGVHLVRENFRFVRGGGVASIPFASVLQNQDTRWIVTSLCYNDTTSGMTDCATPASAPARDSSWAR